MTSSRLLAALLFGAILVGGLWPSHLSTLAGDARRKIYQPDRRTPDYPAFLAEVARRTKPGQSIAIVVPMRYWNAGYSYAYYRASYFLAGRRVVPIVDSDDAVHPERLQEADFVAVWRVPEFAGPEEIWRGHGGVLFRGVR
jgi:hypothetical protein